MPAARARTVLLGFAPGFSAALLGVLLYVGGAWLDQNYLSTFMMLGGLGLLLIGVVLALVTAVVLIVAAVRRRRG